MERDENDSAAPSPIRPEQVQERFDRLTDIFSTIVSQADEQAQTRCPYRDRHDHCTAKFRCRNQLAGQLADDGQTESDPLICTHDGTFDYRRAWESDPRAADVARRRIERQRQRPDADAD